MSLIDDKARFLLSWHTGPQVSDPCQLDYLFFIHVQCSLMIRICFCASLHVAREANLCLRAFRHDKF